MANAINTLKDAPGVISKTIVRMLEDKCVFAKTIDKESSSAFDGMNGFQGGETIQVSKPANLIPGNSADITSTIQVIAEKKAPLTLDIRKVIAIELTSKEIATDLALKAWGKRILDPAMSAMAQYLEATFIERAVDATYNAVGTPGSSTFNTALTLAANQKIRENACPDEDNKFILLNPAAATSAVVARNGLFQSADEIAKQYKRGAMGIADGFTYLTNNLLPTHTNGNDVVFEVRTTVAVEGQSTLVVEGLTTTTGTVTKGTVFTIGSVNAIHPITKEDQGYLQQFVVTEDVTADGSGYATLNISPALYTSASGGLQSVTAFPVDGATITPLGAASTGYKQNLAYHKSAYRMVSVPLIEPGGMDMASQSTYKDFTMRVVRGYTILTDKLIMRLDFLGGFVATRPEWACRLYS